MGLTALWHRWLIRSATAPRRRPVPRARLGVERLERREVPANFTAANVTELIAGMTAANATPEADTITLAPGTTFTLTAGTSTANGATGLPVVTAGSDLTIRGSGDVIERHTSAGTPAFRLFEVEGGAALTLENLTVQGGLVSSGFWYQSQGGAIYNGGTLTLRGVTVQNNVVRGGPHAEGGGIYSAGVLTVEDCTIRDNQALGMDGDKATDFPPGYGSGGGVYVAGGIATMRGTQITGNTAKGGRGYKADRAGDAGPGPGIGGGLYIEADAAVYLDAFTADHIKGNKASTSHKNVYGSYTLLP